MDLNHIALFISLVEAGSLSAAARRQNTAKSNISRALTKLEKDLGVQLIYRNTRHFSITEAGQSLYSRCKSPVFEIKAAADNIKYNDKALKGKLTLTSAVDVAHTILPSIISEFAKSYPQIILDIRAEDRFADLVKEGVDLALRMGPLTDSNLKSTKISDISLILVASPNYMQNKTKIRNLEQVSEHRMISFTKKFEKTFRMIGRNGKKENVHVHTVISANNPLIAKTLTLQGQGIALLPDFICYEELKSGQLIRIMSDYATEASALYYVWPHHATESMKVRAFIDFSRESLRKYFITKRD